MGGLLRQGWRLVGGGVGYFAPFLDVCERSWPLSSILGISCHFFLACMGGMSAIERITKDQRPQTFFKTKKPDVSAGGSCGCASKQARNSIGNCTKSDGFLVSSGFVATTGTIDFWAPSSACGPQWEVNPLNPQIAERRPAPGGNGDGCSKLQKNHKKCRLCKKSTFLTQAANFQSIFVQFFFTSNFCPSDNERSVVAVQPPCRRPGNK